MGVQVNQKDGTRRNNNRGPQGGRLDSQGSLENRVSFIQKNFFHNFRNYFLFSNTNVFHLFATFFFWF